MTTSPYDFVDMHQVKWRFDSSRLPSAIAIKILWEDSEIFEVEMNTVKQIDVRFKNAVSFWRIDINQLRDILRQCETELEEWCDRLREPGGTWEKLQ